MVFDPERNNLTPDNAGSFSVNEKNFVRSEVLQGVTYVYIKFQMPRADLREFLLLEGNRYDLSIDLKEKQGPAKVELVSHTMIEDTDKTLGPIYELRLKVLPD